MTLRCDISIVPYGDEDLTRQIFRLDISNIEQIEDRGFGHQICKYQTILKRWNNETMRSLTGEPEWEVLREDETLVHDRRDGAVGLVRKACELMKDYS